ncbi:hypothetical protein GQ457_01G037250 [Hibiscus cannabinus]
MQHVITAPLANLGGFLNTFCMKRGKNVNSIGRQRYTQLCIGTREVLPTDLSHPLSLGQQVIAIHPKRREVNNEKYILWSMTVQGPLPETLRRQNIAVDDFSATRTPESQVNGHSDFGGPGVYTPSGNLENATSPTNMLANPIKVTIPRNCKRYEDPQVPILYSYRRDEIESYNPPKKRVKNSEADDNDIGCVAAVTLIGALQSGSSPQFSQKSYNKFECRKSAPVQSYDPMLIQSETTKAKLHISSSEHRIAFRLGGKEPVIGTYRRRTGPLVNMEKSAATSEISSKGEKYWKKVKVDETMNNLSNDESQWKKSKKIVSGVTLTGALQRGSSPIFSQIPHNKVECRKSTPVQSCDRMACGGKEPVIGSYGRDESTCLGALLTLAFLSTTMLPTSTVEVESDEKSSASEATSIGHHRDKNNYVGPKEKDLAEEVNKSLTKDKSTSRYTLENQPNKQSLSEDRLKVESNPQAKDAVDYTWFTEKEFLEDLNHVRLGHIPMLYFSFGKFQRFSERSYIDGTQKFEWQHIVKTKWRRLFKRFRAFQEAFCNDSVTGEIVEGSRLKTVSMVDAVIEVQVSFLPYEIESYDPARERVKMSEADDNDNGFALAVTLTGGIAKRKLATVFSKTL